MKVELDTKVIRVVQRVLLDSLIDLFKNPPSEFGAGEDMHFHTWQIIKTLDLSDEHLADLDAETIKQVRLLVDQSGE